MQFIPEAIIDKTADDLGAQDNFEAIIQELKTRQPALLSYLFSETFELLTQKEREFMLFLALVIWKACENQQPEITAVEHELLEDLEESNWGKLNKVTSGKFNERIDVFFNDYPQEDLLAFVEDALTHDEDSEITKEGRDYLFVALKTIIDCLHNCGTKK